jgi:peptide/nickel transport system permease protein
MLRYIGNRLLMLVPVLLGVIIIVFIFQQIAPGDPVVSILGTKYTQEQYDEVREELGIDDPILQQFGRYVWKLVTKGDLGTSYSANQPVRTEIATRFKYTFILTICAVSLGMLIAIPLGVLAAVKQYTWCDSGILALSVCGSSIPTFWLSLMLISLFAVTLGLVPTYGIIDKRGWILPIIVVVFESMSNLIRITRSSLLESIRQDYIRTARSKGQKEYKVIISHALRNSLIPIMSSIGNLIGVQLGGALVIETIFSIPGIGKYALDAIYARNYPAVMGSVVVLAFTFTCVNLIVDLLFVLVDPRMKANYIKVKKRQAKHPMAVGEVH